MSVRFVISFLAVLLVSGCFGEDKPEKLSFSDINEFGWEHVGKKVLICGYPENFYPCHEPSNQGSICARFWYSDIYLTLPWYKYKFPNIPIIFEKKLKSSSIKPTENKFSKLIGVIEVRDKNINGAVFKSPVLVVNEINLINQNLDEDCD